MAEPGWYPTEVGQRYFDGTQWVLSEAERSQRLDAVITEVVRYGGRIESRTATQAVIVTGQPQSGGIHVIHFLMTCLTCGLWVFVWILYAMSRHETRSVVTIDPYGNPIAS